VVASFLASFSPLIFTRGLTLDIFIISSTSAGSFY
jgi:hypothetical protein